MNITEKTILRQNILGQLKDKTISPICLAGAPGTGKSTSVFDLAKELDMSIIDVAGSACTVEFMSG